MTRYRIDGEIPTLAVALSEHMNVGQLSKLASLIGGSLPTRKTELVELIANRLDGDGLRTAWQSLRRVGSAEVEADGGRREVMKSPVRRISSVSAIRSGSPASAMRDGAGGRDSRG